MIPYQKGSSALSQYAGGGFSGVVAIPPPGRPSDSLGSALRAKSHWSDSILPNFRLLFGVPPLGSGRLSSREAVLPLLYCVKEDGLHWRPTARGMSLPAQMCKCRAAAHRILANADLDVPSWR